VPVRGALVGSECLSKVLEDVAEHAPPGPKHPFRADRLAMVGFGLILLLSIPPWTRALGPDLFDAWSPHWSLWALLAASAGLLTAVVAHRRPRPERATAAVYVLSALVAGVAASLHYRYPPALSDHSIVPLLAVGAALVALAGGLMKAAQSGSDPYG
jgi:peptidoglycan/LPS O-acetylase OafA/YrhL